MLNPEFICVIGTVSSYLGNWGKRVNFSNGIAEIQQKYEREEEKCGERKCWISTTVIPNFLCPVLLPVCGVSEVKRKKKKKFDNRIVAMALPKMGGGKKSMEE